MWYIVIVLVLAIGWYGFSRKHIVKTTQKPNNNTNSINMQDFPQDPLIKGSYSKKDIEEKLKRLARLKAPRNLAQGAMCYKVARPADTAHYVCPICGEKTVYKSTKSKEVDFSVLRDLQREIPRCRTIVKKIKGINIALDESAFCKNCSPDVESPELCLKVNIAGTTDTNIVCNVDSDDLTLIHEFIEDELVHKSRTDYETPLKNNIKRIEKLIGVKLKEK